MGFLRKLLGGGERPPDRPQVTRPGQRPTWMQDGMEIQLYEGRVDLEVVGEASYQDNLWRLLGGRSAPEDRVRVDVVAVLVAETDNPYDSNAVSLWVSGLKVGYLSRDDARRYRPVIPPGFRGGSIAWKAGWSHGTRQESPPLAEAVPAGAA